MIDMKDDLNIDDLKKDMPYKVPANFFDNITEKTLSEAKKRRKTLHFSRWKTISVSVAASLLLFFGIRMFTAKELPLNGNHSTAFEETLQKLYSDYSSEIIESIYLVEGSNATNTYNEIDQILSEMQDDELDDIFSDAGSDIFYAKL